MILWQVHIYVYVYRCLHLALSLYAVWNFTLVGLQRRIASFEPQHPTPCTTGRALGRPAEERVLDDPLWQVRQPRRLRAGATPSLLLLHYSPA